MSKCQVHPNPNHAHCCIANNSNKNKLLSVDEMPTYPSGLHGGEKKKLEITGETSDGYHTFNELYHYRMLYNAGFFNMLYIDDLSRDTSDKEPIYRVHKSKHHSDGEECFGGGWFIVMAYLDGMQISNHYELKDWDLFDIPERDIADEWDGHKPDDVANRIKDFLKGAN